MTINYVQKEASIYEFVSINELAAQDGPDIWLVPSEWLPKHSDKLQAAPAGLLAKYNVQPTQQSGFSLFKKASPLPSNAKLYAELFAKATAENNVNGEVIKALPLSVDTLGIYANTALLKAANIPVIPPTWDGIIEATQNLTKKSGLDITSPAIALGTANNISRSSDILATLFIQNHTPMTDPDTKEALLNQTVSKTTGEPVEAGALALDFYTSFASPTKSTYTWNERMPNDFNAFAAGTLPMMIDYSFRLRDLTNAAPSLEYATAPIPQIAGTDQPKVIFTSQMLGVPAVSSNSAVAWDFIAFMTTQENSYSYNRASGRPPARTDISDPSQYENRLAPFIAQIPIASSYYRNEVNKTNQVLRDGITAVLNGQPISEVIGKMSKQITHVLRNEPDTDSQLP